MEEMACYFCKRKAQFSRHDTIFNWNCDVCGHYGVTESYRYSYQEYKKGADPRKVACFLFYDRLINKDLRDQCPLYIHTNDSGKFNEKENQRIITEQDIENWYPKTFAEKINKILLAFSIISKFESDKVLVKYQELSSLFFLRENQEEKTFDKDSQLRFFLNFLKSNQFVDYNIKTVQNGLRYENLGFEFEILSKGYDEIYKLQNNNSNNKKVFVAMAFNSRTNATREAIKQGIKNAELEPVIMDEERHGKQIVPEMLRLIQESRFLIMDITDPNYGAYLEAGYAMGLEKEVIITCKKEIFDKRNDKYRCQHKQTEENTCDYMTKAFRPHFDIVQRQMIVWNDEPHLTKELEEWLKLFLSK